MSWFYIVLGYKRDSETFLVSRENGIAKTHASSLTCMVAMSLDGGSRMKAPGWLDYWSRQLLSYATTMHARYT